MSSRIRRRLAVMRGLFPLRLAGVVLLALALEVSLRLSRAEADYLLYPSGLVVVGLIVVCALLVGGAAITLKRQARSQAAGVPDRLETTHPVATAFRLPRLGRWLILDARLEWVEPHGVTVALTPGDDGRLIEVVTPRARGRHERLIRRFTVEDVFGLAQVSFTLEWSCSLCIVPVAAARAAEVLPSHAFGDATAHPTGRQEGDLIEMRHYAQGDSFRHVLWKTYARTRRLLVRMPERAMAPQPLNVALFVAGAKDEASAGAARSYLERGLLGPDFIFAADGATRPTRSTPEAIEQLVDSAKAQADGGVTLEALVRQIDPSRLTACLVFAPPTDGPWRPRLTELVRRRALSATVVIAVEHLVETATEAPGRLRRLFFSPPQEDRRESTAVAALQKALEADGLRVQLVDGSAGPAW